MNNQLLRTIQEESGLARNTVGHLLLGWAHPSGGRSTPRTRRKLLKALRTIEARCRGNQEATHAAS